MKKLLVFLVTVLALLNVGFAQDQTDYDDPKGKSTVYIDYFKRSSDVPFALSESLRNGVISGIQKMNRVLLIDVDSQDALHVESNRRNSESISAGDDNELDRLAVMGQLGAQYIVTGHVSSLTTTWKAGKDGKPGYYEAVATYALKVINPNNGTLVGTQSYKQTGTDADRQKAMANACTSGASGVMEDFVDEYFKIFGKVIEVNKEKKGKADEVYINVGSQHGVIANQKFTVYLLREVAGRTSRKEIGRLNVKEVEGEDLALCKVNKGGEDIFKAFNDEVPVIIVSRKQTLGGDIGNIFR